MKRMGKMIVAIAVSMSTICDGGEKTAVQTVAPEVKSMSKPVPGNSRDFVELNYGPEMTPDSRPLKDDVCYCKAASDAFAIKQFISKDNAGFADLFGIGMESSTIVVLRGNICVRIIDNRHDYVDGDKITPGWYQYKGIKNFVGSRLRFYEEMAVDPTEAAEKTAIRKIVSDLICVPGRDYLMGKTEVTQAQWHSVMKADSPSVFKGPTHPVDNVSWNECKKFIDALNALAEVKDAKLRFRFPTVVEWEYACRAGSTGEVGNLQDGKEGSLEEMGWYRVNSKETTHPVAQKMSNAWGFFDMHGNVWEWCEDCGMTRSGVAGHITKGDGWYFGPKSCQTSAHNCFPPEAPSSGHIGLRLAADKK